MIQLLNVHKKIYVDWRLTDCLVVRRFKDEVHSKGDSDERLPQGVSILFSEEPSRSSAEILLKQGNGVHTM